MKAFDAGILLIEDNQDDLDLTLHALKRENLANNILVARDGEEALDFFSAAATMRSATSTPLRGWYCST
jgi:two-component system, response regulator